MTELEEAKEFFKNDRYAVDATGIEIEAVGKNYAKCSLKLDSRHRNAAGNVMGGVMFTLADFVFGIASNFKQVPTVTAVSQISYISLPKGEMLYGESKLLKDGKHNCFYEISITDEFGNLIAVVSSSGAHMTR